MFRAVVQPWRDFDAGIVGRRSRCSACWPGTGVALWLPLMSVITPGTLTPYGMEVTAPQHLPPTTGHP